MASQPIFDLNINQNSTFKFNMQLKDSSGSVLDITSWSFTGSIKEGKTSPDPSILFFTMSVVDLTASILEAYLTPSQTTQLVNPAYVYDIIATNYATTPDEVYRILQGKIKVSPGITDSNIGV